MLLLNRFRYRGFSCFMRMVGAAFGVIFVFSCRAFAEEGLQKDPPPFVDAIRDLNEHLRYLPWVGGRSDEEQGGLRILPEMSLRVVQNDLDREYGNERVPGWGDGTFKVPSRNQTFNSAESAWAGWLIYASIPYESAVGVGYTYPDDEAAYQQAASRSWWHAYRDSEGRYQPGKFVRAWDVSDSPNPVQQLGGKIFSSMYLQIQPGRDVVTPSGSAAALQAWWLGSGRNLASPTVSRLVFQLPPVPSRPERAPAPEWWFALPLSPSRFMNVLPSVSPTGHQAASFPLARRSTMYSSSATDQKSLRKAGQHLKNNEIDIAGEMLEVAADELGLGRARASVLRTQTLEVYVSMQNGVSGSADQVPFYWTLSNIETQKLRGNRIFGVRRMKSYLPEVLAENLTGGESHPIGFFLSRPIGDRVTFYFLPDDLPAASAPERFGADAVCFLPESSKSLLLIAPGDQLLIGNPRPVVSSTNQ